MKQKLVLIIILVFFVVAVTVACVLFFFTEFNIFSEQSDISFFLKNTSEFPLHYDTEYPCIHSQIIEQEKLLDQPIQYFNPEEDAVDQQNSQKIASWDTFKIKFDYSNLDKYDSSIKNFIETELIPSASSFFRSFLKVKPLGKTLKIDPYYKRNPCGIPKIKIPLQHIVTGIQDADYIFYISAQHEPGENYLAYASTCPQGKGYGLASGRPTVGYFNMNLSFLEKDIKSTDPMKVSQWIWTTIHEMTHSLVFSPYLFDKFPQKVVKEIDSQLYFTAPNVIELAKKYFDCDSITQIPLENEGGKKTVGFHWERKIFGNEIMTGSTMYDRVISEFTAAVYTASGWYKANTSFTTKLYWGKGKGCQMFKNTCPKKDEPFCEKSQKVLSCGYDYSGLGGCESDNLSDNCPYWRVYSNVHCNYPQADFGRMFTKFGGAQGENTRCWNTDIISRKIKDDKYIASCFESSCDYSRKTTSLKFQGKTYTCKVGQKKIITKQGFIVECPNYDVFCGSQASCTDSCFGRGVCKNGKCSCLTGFTGNNCAKVKK